MTLKSVYHSYVPLLPLCILISMGFELCLDDPLLYIGIFNKQVALS